MADAPPVELLECPPGDRIASAPRVPAGRLQPRSGRRRHRLGPRAMGRNPRRTSSLRRADRIVQPDAASRDAGETEADEPRSMETFLRIRSRTLDPLVCRSRSESALESQGIALFFTGLSREDRRSGQLEQPFDVTVDPGAAYYLTRPSARPMSRSLALFWDWILDEVDLDPFA